MGALLIVLGQPGDPDIEGRLRRMVSRSPHRGGSSAYENNGLAIAVQSLGWDASLARGSTAVVGFHGFVGNWDELRQSHGLRFNAEASHAEIIGAAFEEFGLGIVPLLRGEFAVVIHDLRRGRLLVARDVVGCRPLYMREDDGRFLVATEIRQVVAGSNQTAEPNPHAFAKHLVFEPAIGTETLVADVECVMPGEVYTFTTGRDEIRLRRKAYWRLEDIAHEPLDDEDEWLEELERRMRRTMRRWLPKRPSALTLSGGLDSSALWAEVVSLRTDGYAGAESVKPISAVFPGFPCDEWDFIETTLRETNDQVIVIDGTQETAVGLRPLLLDRLDTAQFSMLYIFHLMAEAAAADGRRTLITGHLADHLFDIRAPGLRGRTVRHLRALLAAILGPRWASGVYSGLKRMTSRKRQRDDLDLLRPYWRESIERNQWRQALAGFSPVHIISKRLMSEGTGWLIGAWEQICARFRAEVRCPFSDPDLIEWAASMPASMLDSELIKPMLREIYRERLPGEIVNRRNKVAFNILALRDRPVLAEAVPPAEWYLVANGIIDPHSLDRLLDEANNECEARNIVLWIEAVESYAQKVLSESENR